MAEYFRDEQNQDVLLFIDNIFRFTQAGSEVSTLLGRMPSAVGYQPTLADEMGELQERITSTRGHSITSLQAIYVPADDITDPAPHTTFAHLDATTVLSRPISEKGIYPAVDPLDSTSRILDPQYVGQEHYAIAQTDRKSTRLNSSHANISYAVFCLKKKHLRLFHLSFSLKQTFVNLLIVHTIAEFSYHSVPLHQSITNVALPFPHLLHTLISCLAYL